MKRKSSTLKTLAKSKQITHDHDKLTIKKSRTQSTRNKLIKSLKSAEIYMTDKNKNPLLFSVGHDRSVYQSEIIIPSIPMIYDNDNESDWEEIHETSENLRQSICVAAYDRKYGAQK